MALIQSDTDSITGATTATAVLTSVVSGNAIIVTVGDNSGNSRSYTASSSIDGGLTQVVVDSYNGRTSRIFWLPSASAGTHTITVTASGNDNIAIVAMEWSGLDPLATPIFSSFVDAGTTTSHFFAASGEIDTTTASVIIVSGVNGGSSTTCTLTDGTYTAISNGNGNTVMGYKEAGSAVTDERSAWSTAVGRNGVGVIAAFPVASGGGSSAIKTWLGLADASVKTVVGLARASVKTKNGLA